MPAERSNQRSRSVTPRFTSPSRSGFATPSSSSRASNPPAPVSVLSRAHGVLLQAAQKSRGSGAVAHGTSPRDRMKRGFSIFKDDLLHRQPSDHQYGHVSEEGEVVEEVVLREDRPGGVAYKDTADLESADTWDEHDRDDQGGTADKDVKMYLRRKRRLKGSKGMYVKRRPFC